MKERTAKRLVEASEGGDNELELYEGYSGRGMYGDTTWGVTGSPMEFARCSAIACRWLVDDEDEAEKFTEEISRTRTDSLGRDTIFY